MGRAHAHALTVLGHLFWPPTVRARLVRVVGRDLARAESTRARSGFQAAGPRWQELVDDPAVQLVHDCAPNHLPPGPCPDAPAAGEHGLSEKPPGRPAAESR